MASRSQPRFLAWSPDGVRIGRLAAPSAPDRVVVHAVATGQRLWSLPRLLDEPGVDQIQWSPDGKLLATFGAAIRLWDGAGGKEVGRLPDSGHTWQEHWSRDGKRLLAAQTSNHPGPRRLTVWDLERRIVVWSRAAQGNDGWGLLAVSGDGRKLAVVHGFTQRSILVLDAATGKDVCTIPHVDPFTQYLTLSPDGRYLAWASGGKIFLRQSSTGQDLPLPTELPSPKEAARVTALAWSADGRRLAIARQEGTILLHGVGESSSVRRLPVPNTTPRALGWSPDGRLASAHQDGIVRVWDSVVGTEVQRLRFPAQPDARNEAGLAWAPEGKRLAVAGDDGIVRVREVGRGESYSSSRGSRGRCRWPGAPPAVRAAATGRGWRPATCGTATGRAPGCGSGTGKQDRNCCTCPAISARPAGARTAGAWSATASSGMRRRKHPADRPFAVSRGAWSGRAGLPPSE